MAKRRSRERLEPSRKQQAMSVRERQEARRVTTIVAVAVGVALLVLLAGLAYQFVVLPNTAVASVDGQRITTRDLWRRAQFDQLQKVSQLRNLLQLQEQFDPGNQQGFFTSQIAQLQNTVVDSESLSNQVLEQMIDEKVVSEAAAKAGVTVSEDEIKAAVDSLIASQQGGVTIPDATATAAALAAATPTPTLAPTATPTATVPSTVTVTPPPTPAPTPTTQVFTQQEVDDGYQQLITNVGESAKIPKDTAGSIYRSLLTYDLLRKKLQEKIGPEMPTTGEQIHARHILISVPQDASQADQEVALAKAISITQQLRNGADFAEMAAKYSDDTSNKDQGGDLGFFPRGQMVKEFEDAAFSLPLNQISDPVKTSFGYHIIEVLEKKPGDPDFNAWLQEQKASLPIVRNLTNARLPSLPTVSPDLLQNPATSAQPTPIVVTPAPAATPAP